MLVNARFILASACLLSSTLVRVRAQETEVSWLREATNNNDESQSKNGVYDPANNNISEVKTAEGL